MRTYGLEPAGGMGATGAVVVLKRLVVPVVLAVALTLVPYVRRGLPRRPVVVTVVDGSRDRTLPGKARRQARKAQRGVAA